MWQNRHMTVIRNSDILAGEAAFNTWRTLAGEALAAFQGSPIEASTTKENLKNRLTISPNLPRKDYALAVRYSLYLMEKLAPGPGVELRVAPYAAVKILDGPKSDPHNLTPPDVIELEPDVWLRLACGITSWEEEKSAGHISAVSPRDDLSRFLPLP